MAIQPRKEAMSYNNSSGLNVSSVALLSLAFTFGGLAIAATQYIHF